MSSQARALVTVTTLALLTCVWGATAAGVHAQQPAPIQRDLPANQPGWMDTGVQLKDGERVTIAASGQTSWDGGRTLTGPAGAAVEACQPVVPGLPIGALVARVGTSAPVLAAGATLSGPGTVQVTYNDCAEQYFDNTGAFAISLDVVRPAPVAEPAVPVMQTEAVNEPQPAGASGGGMRWLIYLVVAALLAAGAYLVWRRLTANRLFFDPTARLESSAWLAPMRLRDLQGERMAKQSLTIGGPDADIDFGISDVRAKLVPTADGATRIELAGDTGRVFVNGTPLILGQRLGAGQHVKIGEREFVYLEERDPRAGQPARQGRPDSALEKPDPRVTAADPASSH